MLCDVMQVLTIFFFFKSEYCKKNSLESKLKTFETIEREMKKK